MSWIIFDEKYCIIFSLSFVQNKFFFLKLLLQFYSLLIISNNVITIFLDIVLYFFLGFVCVCVCVSVFNFLNLWL